MAYNEELANRVRKVLPTYKGITEKKMFGGICFMVNGNMICGVEQDNLVIRVGPDNYEEALKKPHARPMDFTGRPLKGFVYVRPQGHKIKKALISWVKRGFVYATSLKTK